MRQPPKFACNFLRDTSLVGGNPTAVSSSIALPFASVLTISNVLALICNGAPCARLVVPTALYWDAFA